MTVERTFDLKKFSAWVFFAGFVAGVFFDTFVRWLG